MIKQSIIKRIEILQDKSIQILIGKQVVDGDDILVNDNHRTAIMPLGDVEAQMAAVNANLATLKFPAVSNEDIASIRAQADTAWKGYVAPPAIESFI